MRHARPPIARVESELGAIPLPRHGEVRVEPEPVVGPGIHARGAQALDGLAVDHEASRARQRRLTCDRRVVRRPAAQVREACRARPRRLRLDPLPPDPLPERADHGERVAPIGHTAPGMMALEGLQRADVREQQPARAPGQAGLERGILTPVAEHLDQRVPHVGLVGTDERRMVGLVVARPAARRRRRAVGAVRVVLQDKRMIERVLAGGDHQRLGRRESNPWAEQGQPAAIRPGERQRQPRAGAVDDSGGPLGPVAGRRDVDARIDTPAKALPERVRVLGGGRQARRVERREVVGGARGAAS